MRIYIIRHGETAYNVTKRLQGRINEPLNEKGIALAEVTGRALAGVHFDLALTSPLIRSRKTAELVLEHSGNPTTPLMDEERLIEISFGEWEGLCCAEYNYEIPEPDFHQFFRDPFVMKTFPGGEHVQDVVDRTTAFYQELIRRPELQDKTILLSTHGCAGRALMNHLYENPGDFWQGRVPYNCAVNILEVTKGRSVFLEKDKIYYDRSQSVDLSKK